MRFADGIEVVAHRGASAYRPEHRFAAYDLALEQGAHALELDVRMTADQMLVVQHDASLQRTAGRPGVIEQLRRADLARLPRGVRPLRLEEVLERYGRRTRYLIELKDPQPPMGALVTGCVGRAGLADRVVVQSFDRLSLRRIRRHDPELPVALLVPPWRPRWAILRSLERMATFAGAVGVWHSSVDAELLGACRAHGLLLRAWTVNETAALQRLVSLNVDGIITDAPDLAWRAIEGCEQELAIA
jgi:glycerophosphoryl diester phosphodiesterase